ncbi:hypothetical protein KY289_029055 [Solanum tuberosum]|nr:hypothetical protein KY289_029055 [Solanum tuberosum]
MTTPMINNNPRIKDSNRSQGRMNEKNKDSDQQTPSKAAEQGNQNSMSQIQGTHDYSKGDTSSKFSFGVQGNHNMPTPELIRQNKERQQKDNNAQHQGTDHQQQWQVIPSGNSAKHNNSHVDSIKNNAHLQIHANEQSRNLEKQKLQDTTFNSKDQQEHGKQDKRQGNNTNHRFPKISSNFEKQSHPPNRNKIGDQNISGPTVNNPQSFQNQSRKNKSLYLPPLQ